jgi:transposase
MFFPEGRIRVFLYGQAADMRESYDGLYALARQGFEVDVLAGHMFVFINRRQTQMKVLYFDRSGWCLWGKRLESGKFSRKGVQGGSGEIDCTALKLMLEGIEVRRRHQRYQHPARR